MNELPSVWVRDMVARALAEDIGPGDVTTNALVPLRARARAAMRAREPMVVCGLPLACETFRQLSRRLRMRLLRRDGQRVQPGDVLLEVEGSARAILTAERVALNFVQRLSGVATMTARFVEAVAGTQVKILDTRKTTPGWRLAEKYAVACGSGTNHRHGLHDAILIKDNHLATLRDARPNPIAAAVACARRAHPELPVEVEVDTLEQARQALEAGADILLLDNMKPATLRRAVKLVAGRARTEASGRINLRTVRAVARSGVDFISVGALTHSAPAVDVGLDFEVAA